jgi:hypothetical protein
LVLSISAPARSERMGRPSTGLPSLSFISQPLAASVSNQRLSRSKRGQMLMMLRMPIDFRCVFIPAGSGKAVRSMSSCPIRVQ